MEAVLSGALFKPNYNQSGVGLKVLNIISAKIGIRFIIGCGISFAS
jgi:hypothetical protein